MKNCALLVLLLLAAAVYGCAGNLKRKCGSEMEHCRGRRRTALVTNSGCRQTGGEKVEATKKKRRYGSDESWRSLKAVLEAGATDFQSVVLRRRTVTRYSKEIVEREETILGLKVNGKNW